MLGKSRNEISGKSNNELRKKNCKKSNQNVLLHLSVGGEIVEIFVLKKGLPNMELHRAFLDINTIFFNNMIGIDRRHILLQPLRQPESEPYTNENSEEIQPKVGKIIFCFCVAERKRIEGVIVFAIPFPEKSRSTIYCRFISINQNSEKNESSYLDPAYIFKISFNIVWVRN